MNSSGSETCQRTCCTQLSTLEWHCAPGLRAAALGNRVGGSTQMARTNCGRSAFSTRFTQAGSVVSAQKFSATSSNDSGTSRACQCRSNRCWPGICTLVVCTIHPNTAYVTVPKANSSPIQARTAVSITVRRLKSPTQATTPSLGARSIHHGVRQLYDTLLALCAVGFRKLELPCASEDSHDLGWCKFLTWLYLPGRQSLTSHSPSATPHNPLSWTTATWARSHQSLPWQGGMGDFYRTSGRKVQGCSLEEHQHRPSPQSQVKVSILSTLPRLVASEAGATTGALDPRCQHRHPCHGTG